MKRYILILVASLTLSAVEAQVRWGHWQQWGEQPSGTYRNPVIPADYSDRIGIYSFNDISDEGWIDVDYLHYAN